MSTENQSSPFPESEEILPSPPEKKKINLKKELLSWATSLLVALLVVFLVWTFVFINVTVDGSSMADTLHTGEKVFVTKFDYFFSPPQRGDVVICHYPNRSGGFLGLPLNFVKRVIGLPGDTVEIVYDKGQGQNVVYINGQPLDEPYLSPERNRLPTKSMAPVTLGEKEYMVMGDNRDNSNDSRSPIVGPLQENQIVGKARFVFFPFNEIRKVQ